MSEAASSVALANALIRPVNSAADMLVAKSVNKAIVQRRYEKPSVRWTRLRRNLPVDQSDMTFRVPHHERVMRRR